MQSRAECLCASENCLSNSAPGQAYCYPCLRSTTKQNKRQLVDLVARRVDLERRENYKHTLRRMTHLYAIDCAGEAVKLGIARRPKSRLSGIQVSHFVELRLLGAVKVPPMCERLVHLLLSEYRIRGEWFRYSDATNRVVDLIRSQNVDELEKLLGFTMPKL